MLGNDFLPNLTYLTIRNDGILTLLNAYRNAYDNMGRTSHILNALDDTIDIDFLKTFIHVLSKNEDKLFEISEHEYYSKKVYKNAKHNDPKDLENYPLENKFPRVINVNTNGWRRNYYHYLFEKNVSTDIINKSCASFVDGLEWLVNYYFKQTTNWYWFYAYNYSPTILDLSNYLNAIMYKKRTNINETAIREITELDQLIMVMPLSSIYLIPDSKYRQHMTDIDKGYVHNFPIKFEIITFMKFRLHECGAYELNLKEPIII